MKLNSKTAGVITMAAAALLTVSAVVPAAQATTDSGAFTINAVESTEGRTGTAGLKLRAAAVAPAAVTTTCASTDLYTSYIAWDPSDQPSSTQYRIQARVDGGAVKTVGTTDGYNAEFYIDRVSARQIAGFGNHSIELTVDYERNGVRSAASAPITVTTEVDPFTGQGLLISCP